MWLKIWTVCEIFLHHTSFWTLLGLCAFKKRDKNPQSCSHCKHNTFIDSTRLHSKNIERIKSNSSANPAHNTRTRSFEIAIHDFHVTELKFYCTFSQVLQNKRTMHY